MSDQLPASDTPDQDPVKDALDQSTELVGGTRRSGVALGNIVRAAVYGVAFVLVSGLSALAMFPELTRYAEPLLGAGISNVSACSQGACCHAETTEVAAPCEDHCPASGAPSTQEPLAADAIAEVTDPATPADEAAIPQQIDAIVPQVFADAAATTDE